MPTKLLSLAIAASLLTACGGTRENDPVEASTDNLAIALQEAIDQSVIPAVNAFAAQTRTYRTAANSFCATPSQANLANLQEAWESTSEKWFALSNYNFGPVNDDLIFPKYTFIDSLRLRGTNYLETVRTEIANNMSGTATLDEAFFDGQTFQKVGLLALESASFETAASEHSQTPTDIIAEYSDTPKKCDVLNGLAAHLERQADYVQSGWTTDHKNSGTPYRTLFLSEQLEDGTAPLTVLITAVQEYLDYLQQRNVATIAASLSEHSWQSISASIDEVETLLQGTDKTTISFFAIMESSGYQTAVETVQQNIAAVRQTIADRDADMLEIELGKLDGNFKREIPDGLNVELGINFSDGD